MKAQGIRLGLHDQARLGRRGLNFRTVVLMLATFFVFGHVQASPTILLNTYPLISQKDPAAYRDQTLLLVEDTLPGGAGKTTVPNLACAATVYTMLDRGRGNLGATIDDFYQDPRKYNGNGPGAKRPSYVGSDLPFDARQLIVSLKSGQPVILHGFGGPLKEHFVLAVGLDTTVEETPVVTVLDPYPGNEHETPGKQIEISLAIVPPAHPAMREVVFRQMRLVTKANLPDALTFSTENYAVGLKDSSVLVGKIQLREVEFKTSYGGVTVALRDLVSYKDGFLLLRDGTKLKGGFPNNSLALQTARGLINLPVDSVDSITQPSKPSSPSNETSQSPETTQPLTRETSPSDNAPKLSGKVLSCFGQPLPGVAITVQNSRFATTTDAEGNYSVSYVPGTLKVYCKKQGFYPVSLDLQITTSAPYPVQDQQLIKVPPSKGIYFVGKNDYVPLKQNTIEVRTVENKGGGSMLNPERESAQNIYTVKGQPTIIQRNGDLVFIDSDGAHNSVCHVYTGQEFYRRRMFGIGLGFKHDYEQMDAIDTQLADDVFQRKLVLTPGDYVFVSHLYSTLKDSVQMAVGGTIGEPSYFFRIVDK